VANIIPFKGIRPAKDKVQLVASRSVDGYPLKDLQDKLKSNPYTFLHIINPDFDDGQPTRPGSKERLQKIKQKYEDFKKSGILLQDKKTCYYIYQQYKEGTTFTGIIGCSSINDYFKGVIKIHEQTLTEREEKLKKYLEICDFNAEPVLFSYPNDEVIDHLTAAITDTTPTNDFTTTDRISHKLWAVQDEKTILTLQERFRQIPAVYIADGHHRSASSALLGRSLREKNKTPTGTEPYNYYLGIFFPETQLKIYDFNRIIKDLNNLTIQQFLEKLSEKFEWTDKGSEIYKPVKVHNFSMYLKDKWYTLTPKAGVVNDKEPVGSLDASILTKHILSPILGINDLKTDKRIAFVPGVKGMQELKEQVDKGNASIAFALYPVSMQQLKHIADTNNIMPPKTTWIEPKMRSGLVIYDLEIT